MMSGSISRLKMTINGIVYASVCLGVILLIQVNQLLPTTVFMSILGGWVAYLICALAVARGYRIAYPVILVLAVVTLIVSLPQPEHYAFVNNAQILAAATFLLGSILQLCLIVLIPVFLVMERNRPK